MTKLERMPDVARTWMTPARAAEIRRVWREIGETSPQPKGDDWNDRSEEDER